MRLPSSDVLPGMSRVVPSDQTVLWTAENSALEAGRLIRLWPRSRSRGGSLSSALLRRTVTQLLLWQSGDSLG